MYCPKCGTQAIDGTKFCRSCGMDLEAVAAVLSGKLSLTNSKKLTNKADDPNNVDKVWSNVFSNGAIGLAFLLIAFFLTVTNAANGGRWGFWMLIPGAACLSSGVASYFKARRIERRNVLRENASSNEFLSSHSVNQLPPQRETFADLYSPSARNTGELAMPPASVTENTTRHLQTNPEDETINLPLQK